MPITDYIFECSPSHKNNSDTHSSTPSRKAIWTTLTTCSPSMPPLIPATSYHRTSSPIPKVSLHLSNRCHGGHCRSGSQKIRSQPRQIPASFRHLQSILQKQSWFSLSLRTKTPSLLRHRLGSKININDMPWWYTYLWCRSDGLVKFCFAGKTTLQRRNL